MEKLAKPVGYLVAASQCAFIIPQKNRNYMIAIKKQP
jgi:hypothetical protein